MMTLLHCACFSHRPTDLVPTYIIMLPVVSLIFRRCDVQMIISLFLFILICPITFLLLFYFNILTAVWRMQTGSVSTCKTFWNFATWYSSYELFDTLIKSLLKSHLHTSIFSPKQNQNYRPILIYLAPYFYLLLILHHHSWEFCDFCCGTV